MHAMLMSINTFDILVIRYKVYLIKFYRNIKRYLSISIREDRNTFISTGCPKSVMILNSDDVFINFISNKQPLYRESRLV